MFSIKRLLGFTVILSFIFLNKANGQVLYLKDAVRTALNNYGTVKAKANYVDASKALVKESSREYLPDLNIAIQQDYGTINEQSGPLYGFKGYGVASSGPILPSQNWDAAFGALYVSNINWDFFAFGKAKQRVKVAQSELLLNVSDLEQEKFQHEIRVSGAYLNLLAAQSLTRSQQDNLERAIALRNVVAARTMTGLNPGVDSSLANAEVSNAKIALIRAMDYEQEQSSVLAKLMGVNKPIDDFSLDSFFIRNIPKGIYDTVQANQQDHPLLKFYHDRITLSDETARYYKSSNYPVFSLFGIFQGRGSGFDYNYGAQGSYDYSHGYWSGVDPTRANYLFGIGMSWNLTTPLRTQQQVAAQHLISKGLQDEYNLANQNLIDELILSDAKMKNAMASYFESPVQVKAARDAYEQKTVMYKHGLSNIVDLTQALFTLNRAEIDRSIVFNNVWQALLLKAAATGDFGIFINAF